MTGAEFAYKCAKDYKHGMTLGLGEVIAREFDAAVAEQWKELQAARADAAAMREAMSGPFDQYLGNGDEPTLLDEAFKVFRSADAGRALLAEVTRLRDQSTKDRLVIDSAETQIGRLREENAALTKRISDMEAHGDVWMNKYDDLNSRYSFKIVEMEEQRAALVAALGRTHAALKQAFMAIPTQCECGACYRCKAHASISACEKDPEGRAAFEYLAALLEYYEASENSEFHSCTHPDKSPPPGHCLQCFHDGTKRAQRLRDAKVDAHAAVEALRGK